MNKLILKVIGLSVCALLSGCAVIEVGDLVVSGAVDVASAGVSVITTGVKAVVSVIDSVTPDLKSK